jgi:aldose sugar dehydrogenase
MKVDQIYSTHCASCHGAKFEGGQGGVAGGRDVETRRIDEEIFRSIAKGNLQMGMTPWEGILTDKQIRSMVIFLREKENKRW